MDDTLLSRTSLESRKPSGKANTRKGRDPHLRLGGRDLLDERLGDGDLDVHPGLDRDRGDLTDHLGRRLEVDDALVDAHLEAVPGLRTLTARGTTGGDAQGAGRHADGATHADVLALCTVDEVLAHLLEVADLARRQGDADAVHRNLLGRGLLHGDGGRHVWLGWFGKKQNETHKGEQQKIQERQKERKKKKEKKKG